MGCCYSSSRANRNEDENMDTNGLPTGSNKPFRRNKNFKTEKQMTEAELKQKRDTFWDTAPKYDGRTEIWLAIKCACETDDDALAQAILDGANVVIPTGFLNDGAYDELGNRYIIPEYCIADPVNLIRDQKSAGSSASDKDNSTPTNADLIISDRKSCPYPILLRLSTNKDVKFNQGDLYEDDTLATLTLRLYEAEPEAKNASNVRFLCMGRLLDPTKTLKDAIAIQTHGGIKIESVILQVMLSFS